MARKPHAAYFAGMRYVPMPDVDTFEELIASGKKSGSHYLFFSAIEASLRPQFAVLLDPGVRLPGLEPLAWNSLGPVHTFAIYRFTGETVDPVALGDSLMGAIRRYTDRRPGDAWPHTYMAGHLLNRGHPREALDQLALAERLSPGDVMVARMQAVGWTALGEFDRAVTSCERAIALGSDGAWEEATLGRARLLQGRYAEARRHLADAVLIEPTNPEYAHALGIATFESGDRAGAIEVFDRLLASHPEDDEARYYAARARALRGDVPGALRVLAPALGRSPALAALADSLRRGERMR
jgi:tetratricopeptide (TPR) repeat protein